MVPVMSSLFVILGTVVFSLALMAGIIILQIYLSKRASKWLGLILPVITFGISMLQITGFLLYSIVGSNVSVGTHSVVQEEALVAERHAIIEHQRGHGAVIIGEPHAVAEVHHLVDYGHIGFSPVATVFFLLVNIIVSNIPTIILLAIYAVCRGSRKKRAALELMSLQDL